MIKEYIKAAGKKPQQRQIINEALHVLSCLGIPFSDLSERRLEKMAMAFLAVIDLRSGKAWGDAKSWSDGRALKSRDIITYINKHFDESISSGSYDDIRRKDLILPVTAGIIQKSVENPNAARNDPTRAYALASEYSQIVKSFGQKDWNVRVDDFMSKRSSLAAQLAGQRSIRLIPVKLPQGGEIILSPGDHNDLQRKIIEDFLPRYGFGAKVLYLGDTAKKLLIQDIDSLDKLGMARLAHGELPDVLAYSEAKNWLYLIEAVHSSGPMSSLRVASLKGMLSKCTAEPIFISAFNNRDTFRRFSEQIAWETEVWVADSPDHLIHFNGDKFLGPFKKH